ncbi:MAG: peptide deformylase, partial [Rhodobacteraceae bacterium]|nr:peptide deformylase [Paracoccaceae bacterium]
MPIRTILIHPEPKLRKVSLEVKDLSDRLINLADDMLQTMYDAPGIGLAAPQIGLLVRLIVIDCNKEDELIQHPIQMFNPEIIETSDEKNIQEEGCLSIPNQFGEVERPSKITVRWIDRDGNEKQESFDGLWATCIQHEVDHLDGKLFI